jgi:prolipoprotein diacylglyceryltransferase
MNSEIIGAPTDKKVGFLFVNGIDKYFAKANHHVFKDTEITQMESDTIVEGITYTKLRFDAWFYPRFDSVFINGFMIHKLPGIVSSTPRLNTNFRLFPNPELSIMRDRSLTRATMVIYGIPRHPSQLYEAAYYMFLFILFYGLYKRKQGKTTNGIFFGIFLILMFTFRFLVEFLKENQVSAEQNMFFNIGQLLSIPFIMAGIVIVIIALYKKRAPETGHP